MSSAHALCVNQEAEKGEELAWSRSCPELAQLDSAAGVQVGTGCPPHDDSSSSRAHCSATGSTQFSRIAHAERAQHSSSSVQARQ
jgi:hypothetical protein